ncbi:MAG: TPM domain-containing protein [Spirochaetota bacterium]
MAKKSDKFFTEDEKALIENTILDVETRTSGEIVVMTVDESDRYEDAETMISILSAAALSVYPAELFYMKGGALLQKILPVFSWQSSIPDGARFISGLAVFILMVFILHYPFKVLLARCPSIKRLFLNDARKQAEVRERALRAFHEHRLDRTADATGVLFMISLLEHKVYVLADHGIYVKISQSALDGYASAVASGVAQKRTAEALCEAIRAIGADLSHHFPSQRINADELSNKVISE